ncbi:hypothetical protein H8A97_02225 [Bradyrhizobium sp. Arg62]|uniref:hypothetical protein n=1 Tax=Bradyrhizobium brasilense TaxID=1419277 RepID=UPI001E45147D|nr:hypothetical protein [Bradyrhizobium brasilense]MCC8943949.1 hypothetical protein [Bradyrhizobium brasilense]
MTELMAMTLANRRPRSVRRRPHRPKTSRCPRIDRREDAARTNAREPSRIFAGMNRQHRRNIRQTALVKAWCHDRIEASGLAPSPCKWRRGRAAWAAAIGVIGRIVSLIGGRICVGRRYYGIYEIGHAPKGPRPVLGPYRSRSRGPWFTALHLLRIAIGAIGQNHNAPFVVIGELQQTFPDEGISLFGERPHSPRSLFAKMIVHGVPLNS